MEAVMSTPAFAPAPKKQVTTPMRRPTNPFELMRSVSEEMDRLFGDFGIRRRWPFAMFGRESGEALWAPDIEVEERGSKLIVRADLPGLTKNDVKVEVTDDALTIEGERTHEEEKKEERYYDTERSYGRFSRSIALPEGANAETAKATFKDGVLEITLDAPEPRATTARRLDIA
jgi:HSP20 family protein